MENRKKIQYAISRILDECKTALPEEQAMLLNAVNKLYRTLILPTLVVFSLFFIQFFLVIVYLLIRFLI